MKKFSKVGVGIIAIIGFLSSCSSPLALQSTANAPGPARAITSFAKADYATALKDAVYFYDANKCGPDTGVDQFFDWRAACHTADGADIGIDLTGGFHDAGDHVKFGLPQGYAAATLGWGLYEFGSAYADAAIKTKTLATLKIFTDYFLKSHPNPTTFYYQVGNGDQDHQYWGSPERQSLVRPTRFVANAATPASDVLGVTSAALSLMYLNYLNTDAGYAAQCLQAAKELYLMGKTNPGKGQEESYYTSHSYYDDLAWSAVWLFKITGETSYQTDIDGYLAHQTEFGSSPFEDKWTMCWDDSYLSVFTKMAELTGQKKYKDAVEFNLNYWMNSLTKTPGGLRYLDGWGALRYAMAESMIALLYYRQTGVTAYKDFAASQVDYALGKNPANMSYMIGFGAKYPLIPHHRAANGYQGYNDNHNNLPALHVLTGGLVGGPDQSDTFNESNGDYKYTEVAIDYNAGFVGALAGIITYADGTIPSPTPSLTPTNTPTTTPTTSPTATPSSTPPPSETPYTGTRITLPGTIEAENFDNGAEGVAYHDSDASNSGAAYRNTSVDIEACGEGGYNVGWTANGEWLNYMVSVATGGSYTISARVASTIGNRTIHLEIDNVNVTGAMTVPNTGAWQTFATINSAAFQLSAGNHTVKLCLDGDSINVNWIQINNGTGPSPTPTATPTATPSSSPTATPIDGVKVSYAKNDWGSGFTGTITLTNNTSQTVNNWKIAFAFAGSQTITQFWSTALTQSGQAITAGGLSYNSSIPPNASVNFGFTANYSGSNIDPTAFIVTY